MNQSTFKSLSNEAQELNLLQMLPITTSPPYSTPVVVIFSAQLGVNTAVAVAAVDTAQDPERVIQTKLFLTARHLSSQLLMGHSGPHHCSFTRPFLGFDVPPSRAEKSADVLLATSLCGFVGKTTSGKTLSHRKHTEHIYLSSHCPTIETDTLRQMQPHLH